MGPDASLARILASRLCHDLSGMVGTLSGTLDFVQQGDAELLDLARETAATLRQRLQLYAAAWGMAGEERDAGSLAALLAAAPAAPRVRFRLDGLAGAVPGPLVPLMLNAALLAAEALPRGGQVHLSGSAADGVAVWPDGQGAAWPAALLGLLAGGAAETALEAGPRRVLAPLLASLAAGCGWGLSLGHGAGPAPLLLAPL